MTNYAPNSADEAVARARRSSVWRPKGMCLNYVWDALTSQVKSYGLRNAHAGWERTTLRRFDRTPPAGAPVYWTGYEHGHVALSVGGGKVRSTDNPTNEQVSEVTLAQIERRWPGLTYAGYGLDFAGDPIRGLATITPTGDLSMSDAADILAAINKLSGQEANRYSDLAGRMANLSAAEAGRYSDLAARIVTAPDASAIAAALEDPITEAVTAALATAPQAGDGPTPAQVAAAVVDRLASALAAPPAA